MGSSQAGLAPAFDAFRKGLHERGWIENQNIAIEYRWAGDSTDRLPELAAELARLKVDIIIGSTPGVGAAQQATPRIPIIMYIADDAVKQGSVANLARPSGNITGMAERCLDDIAKRQALFGCEGRTFGVHPLRTWRERTSRRLICDFHNPRRSSPPGRGAEAFGKAQRPSLRRERPRCGRAQTGLSKERRTIVFTMKWHPMRMITLMLAFLGVMAQSANADAVRDGPKVGPWKTWVLTSGKEIQVPAPPPETSDQTKAELAELRQLQKERSPSANTAIQYYNAVPATQRWHDLAHTIARAEKQSLNRQAWMASILHTALHDAVIVTWAAKYQFNRKPPSQMASDLTVVVPITGEVSAPEPSYPSEHAAIAGTAIGILTAYFPKEAANLKAAAAELGQTRLLMGANYRSDIDAGLALGQAVAQKALARAATDGSGTKWTGTVPTGPGLWVGKDPLESLMGTWKPWLMARGDQFRPGPPPAFGSTEFQAELALVKGINSSPTPSQRAIATNFAAKGLDFVWEPGYALVRRERLSAPREVRLLAPFAALQADAYIAAHDTKYTFWTLRPSTADPTIVPLIPVPNHPAYVSNAAIIASAVAELVGYMFPQDAARWQYLGTEAGFSRIYGGIHYPSDERVGNQMGKNIGALAIQRDKLNGQ